jgi:hypothetical protein
MLPRIGDRLQQGPPDVVPVHRAGDPAIRAPTTGPTAASSISPSRSTTATRSTTPARSSPSTTGYDFAELIAAWSGLDVEVVRFHDHRHGVIGDFTEVYLATRGDAG